MHPAIRGSRISEICMGFVFGHYQFLNEHFLKQDRGKGSAVIIFFDQLTSVYMCILGEVQGPKLIFDSQ